MTLADLRSLIRLTLASVADWPDSTLDRWIAQAVRFYSAHFPRRCRVMLELTSGQQVYDLPGGSGLSRVLAVIYPAGRYPESMLRHVVSGSRTRDDGCWYSLIGAPEEGNLTGRIVLGPPAQTGEQVAIEYLTVHALPGSDAGEMTVPPQHTEAITAFVEFAAHYELESDAVPLAEAATIVLAQLGDEARKAWLRYKEVMDRLTWLGAASPFAGAVVSWGDIGL